MTKPLTVWIKTNCGNSERDGNTRPHDLPPEKSVCKRSNSWNWTWKNRMEKLDMEKLRMLSIVEAWLGEF